MKKNQFNLFKMYNKINVYVLAFKTLVILIKYFD